MESLELKVGGHKYPLVKELPPEEKAFGIGYFSANGNIPKHLDLNLLRHGFGITSQARMVGVLGELTKKRECAIIIYNNTMRVIAYGGSVDVLDNGATNLKGIVDSYNGK